MTAVVPIAVALTIATPTGGAGAGARRPTPAWVCVERPIERIDAQTRPLFVFIEPRLDGVRAPDSLAEGKKVCAEVAAGAIEVDARLSPDERKPATELCPSPIRLHLAPEAFLHVSTIRSPRTPSGQCPWAMIYSIDDPTVPRKNELADLDFAILPAVTSYEEARKLAEGTSAQLGLRLDLRRALPDGHGHLTFSKADCQTKGRPYPCFVARGLLDRGSYVSIEDGSTLAPCGLTGYVVVIANGPKGDAGVRATLDKARKLFPAVTIVTDQRVTLGCIH